MGLFTKLAVWVAKKKLEKAVGKENMGQIQVLINSLRGVAILIAGLAAWVLINADTLHAVIPHPWDVKVLAAATMLTTLLPAIFKFKVGNQSTTLTGSGIGTETWTRAGGQDTGPGSGTANKN